MTDYYTERVRRAVVASFPHRRQRLLWVVHEPDVDFMWAASAAEFRATVFDNAMVNNGKPGPVPMQLVTIAPGTAAYTKALAEAWAAGLGMARTADVSWMVPLFPLPSPPQMLPSKLRDICIQASQLHTGPCSATRASASARHVRRPQGKIELTRRNYAAAFDALNSAPILQLLDQLNESLVLLGDAGERGDIANLHPPATLRPRVQLVSSLGMPYKVRTCLTRLDHLARAYSKPSLACPAAGVLRSVALLSSCPHRVGDRHDMN